mmetsp:Transcript_53984/g.121065  ORF Transcript_53984/g.121065 Transcript_53984/m.121065 type:complete len:97 (+) Transcript_53984:18-308(+)
MLSGLLSPGDGATQTLRTPKDERVFALQAIERLPMEHLRHYVQEVIPLLADQGVDQFAWGAFQRLPPELLTEQVQPTIRPFSAIQRISCKPTRCAR